MRTLLHNEMKNVTGAGYSEDIVTAAASIYVGSTIGRLASTMTFAIHAEAANSIANSGFETLAWATEALGMFSAPIMFIAAPMAAFEFAYPGVLAKKADAYFN